MAGNLSLFLARLSGVVWLVGAGFLLTVTVLFLPVVIVTGPWALAMLIVGRPLLRARWSTPRTIASLLLSAGSLVLIATLPDQDIRPWVVAPSVAGLASLVALACHGLLAPVKSVESPK
jgi:hypothetical protein